MEILTTITTIFFTLFNNQGLEVDINDFNSYLLVQPEYEEALIDIENTATIGENLDIAWYNKNVSKYNSLRNFEIYDKQTDYTKRNSIIELNPQDFYR